MLVAPSTATSSSGLSHSHPPIADACFPHSHSYGTATGTDSSTDTSSPGTSALSLSSPLSPTLSPSFPPPYWATTGMSLTSPIPPDGLKYSLAASSAELYSMAGASDGQPDGQRTAFRRFTAPSSMHAASGMQGLTSHAGFYHPSQHNCASGYSGGYSGGGGGRGVALQGLSVNASAWGYPNMNPGEWDHRHAGDGSSLGGGGYFPPVNSPAGMLTSSVVGGIGHPVHSGVSSQLLQQPMWAAPGMRIVSPRQVPAHRDIATRPGAAVAKAAAAAAVAAVAAGAASAAGAAAVNGVTPTAAVEQRQHSPVELEEGSPVGATVSEGFDLYPQGGGEGEGTGGGSSAAAVDSQSISGPASVHASGAVAAGSSSHGVGGMGGGYHLPQVGLSSASHSAQGHYSADSHTKALWAQVDATTVGSFPAGYHANDLAGYQSVSPGAGSGYTAAAGYPSAAGGPAGVYAPYHTHAPNQAVLPNSSSIGNPMAVDSDTGNDLFSASDASSDAFANQLQGIIRSSTWQPEGGNRRQPSAAIPSSSSSSNSSGLATVQRRFTANARLPSQPSLRQTAGAPAAGPAVRGNQQGTATAAASAVNRAASQVGRQNPLAQGGLAKRQLSFNVAASRKTLARIGSANSQVSAGGGGGAGRVPAAGLMPRSVSGVRKLTPSASFSRPPYSSTNAAGMRAAHVTAPRATPAPTGSAPSAPSALSGPPPVRGVQSGMGKQGPGVASVQQPVTGATSGGGVQQPMPVLLIRSKSNARPVSVAGSNSSSNAATSNASAAGGSSGGGGGGGGGSSGGVLSQGRLSADVAAAAAAKVARRVRGTYPAPSQNNPPVAASTNPAPAATPALRRVYSSSASTSASQGGIKGKTTMAAGAARPEKVQGGGSECNDVSGKMGSERGGEKGNPARWLGSFMPQRKAQTQVIEKHQQQQQQNQQQEQQQQQPDVPAACDVSGAAGSSTVGDCSATKSVTDASPNGSLQEPAVIQPSAADVGRSSTSTGGNGQVGEVEEAGSQRSDNNSNNVTATRGLRSALKSKETRGGQHSGQRQVRFK